VSDSGSNIIAITSITRNNIFTYRKIPVERVARGEGERESCSTRHCREMSHINVTFNIRVDIFHIDGTSGASDVDLFHGGCIADED
jgi:hypothetical protein